MRRPAYHFHFHHHHYHDDVYLACHGHANIIFDCDACAHHLLDSSHFQLTAK